uniref:Uncharacterized protein n=1 Tax=Anguilla anguilla TaxID=7936 RepID=A0A0E9V5D8_ANGAN
MRSRSIHHCTLNFRDDTSISPLCLLNKILMYLFYIFRLHTVLYIGIAFHS